MKFRRLASMIAASTLLLSFGGVVGTPAQAAALDKVPFTITNNSGITDAQLYVGVMGTNPATGKDAYLVPDGSTWRLQDIPIAPAYPHPPQTLPGVMFAGPTVGQSLQVATPHMDSGRLYYSWGTPLQFEYVQNDLGHNKIVYPDHNNEPNRSTLWGSAEYTYDANDVLWYNSTQVDFFGPPAQVGIADSTGNIKSTGRLAANGFDYVHTELAKHGEWSKLVEWGPYDNVVRVLNPSHKLGRDGFNAGSLQSYIDQVWDKYRSTDMQIRPIGDDPSLVFTGRVGSDNVFRFTTTDPRWSNDPVAINRPTPWEALACAGPLTGGGHHGWVGRTICAGFNRSSLMTHTNQPTTNDKFYTDPQWTNWYVKIVHEAMATGHAYAFAYDDVGGYESLTAVGNPSHAYLQLDPFSGSVDPIGTEPGGGGDGGDDGSNPGGGDNGGGDDGSNPGGGDNGGGGDDGGNPGGGDDGSNPGGGDNGGGGDDGGGDNGGGDNGGGDNGGGDNGGGDNGGDNGGNPGGGDDGGNPGGGDDGSNPGGGDNGNNGGGGNPGGGGNGGNNGGSSNNNATNPAGTIRIGTTLSATVGIAPGRPNGKRQWYSKNVQVTAAGVAPAGSSPTLQIKVGKAPWTTYTGTVTLKKAGKVKVRARVIAPGKVSPADVIKVKVDKKAPTKIKAKRNKAGIKLSAKDKTSKIARIQYRINGKGKWRTYKGKRLKVRASIKRIKVRAFDRAGNKSKVKTFKVKTRK